MKKRHLPFLLLLVLGLLLMPACRPGEDKPEPEPPRETVIHVAGWGQAPAGSAPFYWQDGELEYLDACVSPGSLIGGGSAYSIFVSGNDVYVAGWIFCKGHRACYWKNGVRTDLDQTLGTGYPRSIYVSGPDVYVAGWIDRFDFTIPCYWKNGARTDLSRRGASAMAKAIYVSGGDVYVSGETNVSVNAHPGIAIPCYWKNGARTDLSVIDPQREGYASAICFSAGSVYVAGSVVDTEHSGVPCYWVNGARIDLSRLSAYTGWAESIQVSGSDVYVGGATQSATTEIIPCYWKNENRSDLSVVRPGRGGYVNSLFVLGNDVFAAGYGGVDWNPGSDYAVPCYWKNETRVDLNTGAFPGAMATAIYVAYK
jgi:hypothetical protein